MSRSTKRCPNAVLIRMWLHLQYPINVRDWLKLTRRCDSRTALTMTKVKVFCSDFEHRDGGAFRRASRAVVTRPNLLFVADQAIEPLCHLSLFRNPNVERSLIIIIRSSHAPTLSGQVRRRPAAGARCMTGWNRD